MNAVRAATLGNFSPAVFQSTSRVDDVGLEGVRRGESVLYVSLSETREELEAIATSHGWDSSGIPIFELASGVEYLNLSEQNTLFEPSEAFTIGCARPQCGHSKSPYSTSSTGASVGPRM